MAALLASLLLLVGVLLLLVASSVIPRGRGPRDSKGRPADVPRKDDLRMCHEGTESLMTPHSGGGGHKYDSPTAPYSLICLCWSVALEKRGRSGEADGVNLPFPFSFPVFPFRVILELQS